MVGTWRDVKMEKRKFRGLAEMCRCLSQKNGNIALFIGMMLKILRLDGS